MVLNNMTKDIADIKAVAATTFGISGPMLCDCLDFLLDLDNQDRLAGDEDIYRFVEKLLIKYKAQESV
jgi:hypothetical protein